MLGMPCPQNSNDGLFGSKIGFGDQVDVALVGNRHSGGKFFHQHPPRFPGGKQQRVSHDPPFIPRHFSLEANTLGCACSTVHWQVLLFRAEASKY